MTQHCPTTGCALVSAKDYYSLHYGVSRLGTVACVRGSINFNQMQSERVCVIGAGAAGIAAAAALSEIDAPFNWFEAGSQFGGLWRYGNDAGCSVYASLATNTSLRRMEWFGYKFPDRKNDYLGHPEVLEYLSGFLNHAGLRDRITTSTRVTKVDILGPGRFRVHAEHRNGEQTTGEYRAVIVANGRNAVPKLPNIPGMQNVATMHASEYRTPDIFADKNVVVVGFGASGVDIASDAADVAKSVVLSSRGGGFLVPKYVGGRPRDENERAWLSLIPLWMRRQMWRAANLRRPSPPKVRMLERGVRPFEKPAVLSDRIGALIEADKVVLKRGIQKVNPGAVTFDDASIVPCDVMVFATGYATTFPFFSDEVTARNGAFVDRYFRVIPPQEPGLYFVGQLSVAGPLFPLFERQARWVADVISGKCVLPRPERMRKLAAAQSRLGRKRFPDSTQPHDFVEFYTYVRGLEKEHQAGRFRERAAVEMVA